MKINHFINAPGKYWIGLLFIGIFITACDFTSQKESRKSDDGSDWFITKSGDSVLRRYNEDGSPKSYSTYVNKIKNGRAKKFYPSGKTEIEMSYKDGKKHGLVKWYYEDGTLFREINYNDGLKDGIEKKYYAGGILLAEVPFKNDKVIPGLKEYTKSGKLKKIYPTLIIEPIDRLAFEDVYILRLSLSSKVKNAKFFKIHKNDNNSYSYYQELTTEKGYGELVYFVTEGGYVMEKARIRGEYKTSLGNIFVVERTYNVAIDN